LKKEKKRSIFQKLIKQDAPRTQSGEIDNNETRSPTCKATIRRIMTYTAETRHIKKYVLGDTDENIEAYLGKNIAG